MHEHCKEEIPSAARWLGDGALGAAPEPLVEVLRVAPVPGPPRRHPSGGWGLRTVGRDLSNGSELSIDGLRVMRICLKFGTRTNLLAKQTFLLGGPQRWVTTVVKLKMMH